MSINLEDFYRALKIWHFDFEIEEGGIEKLYIGYRYKSGDYYEAWANSENMWLLINGLYINAVLWEYLAAIGALDIAYLPPTEFEYQAFPYADFDDDYYSIYDGLLFFRINPLGAYLFGQAGDYQAATPASTPVLRVDADRLLQILDPARVTPILKAQFDQIATPEGDSAYRLDAQKLLPAFEEGFALETVHDFLARNSAQPVPAEVSSWLEQLHQASRAFSVGAKMLRIGVANIELVQVALADPELSKFCRLLGTCALVIPAGTGKPPAHASARTRLWPALGARPVRGVGGRLPRFCAGADQKAIVNERISAAQ